MLPPYGRQPGPVERITGKSWFDSPVGGEEWGSLGLFGTVLACFGLCRPASSWPCLVRAKAGGRVSLESTECNTLTYFSSKRPPPGVGSPTGSVGSRTGPKGNRSGSGGYPSVPEAPSVPVFVHELSNGSCFQSSYSQLKPSQR